MHNAELDTINKILSGDKAAFRTLYDTYKRPHLLTCLRYVKDRSFAEDMLQEAFITIYRDLKQFNPKKGNFKTWSTRLVINVCLQELRKKHALKDSDDIVEAAHTIKTDSKALQNLNLQDITNLLLKLPAGYRTVFNMYVIDGYTHKEIAKELGISDSTSKTQLMKAKNLLKELIKDTDTIPAIKYAY